MNKTMRIKDILPYINIEKIKVKILKDILNDFCRKPSPNMDPETMVAMYGDEAGEVEIERARAEVDRLRAAAARDWIASRVELRAGRTRNLRHDGPSRA